MKVRIKNRTYIVEFLTQAKSPKYGKDKHPVLVQTGCSIINGSKTVISNGSATQNYHDELDWHTGRKVSMARALGKTSFDKEQRAIFWNMYKEEFSVKNK